MVEIVDNSADSADKELGDDIASSVYAYLSVILSESEDIDTSKTLISENVENIDYIVGELLSKNDTAYSAEVEVNTVKRDSRQCGNVVIEEGSYQTLLITLGDGNGSTNWSIAYPALTYVQGEDPIIVKSKIYEIIKEKKS